MSRTSEKSHEYLISEATVVGSRVTWYLEALEKIETFVMIGSFGFWGFIMTIEYSPLTEYLKWIPPFMTLFYSYKAFLYTKTINQAFKYINRVEKLMKLPKNLGWVHFFRTQKAHSKRRWRLLFWVLMTILNVLIAFCAPFSEIVKSS